VFEGPESQRASLSVLVGGATANVAEHTHDRSYELLTAVMADGLVNVWGTGEGSLGHQSVVRPGDPQVIPAGVRHEWVGAGTVPLIAVQAYAPSGPEQRFRAMSSR
jgi:quercetin dioxygenase-like cupin family protein